MNIHDVDFNTLVENSLRGLKTSPGAGTANTSLPSAPVVALVDRLICDALDMNASDLHLEPSVCSMQIRMRIDGILHKYPHNIPLELIKNIIGRIKIMSGLNTFENRLPQDGRISFSYHEQTIDIRVSTMPLLNGEKVVLRLLNASHQFLNISELDFSATNEQLFRSWYHKPNGLILNVGPVNSGKTTTLYAALNELNDISQNIVTIEDPVEYHLPGINQIQINEKIDFTFIKALRAILRQDPNIIMLGEIRDEETAEIAIRAALTGHLLFTTLHTGDSVGAIFRLLDMGVLPYLLSASLIGIMAQRLVRRLCPHCREKYKPEPNSPDSLLLGSYFDNNTEIYRANGCEKCHQSGYSGRLAIHELLPITDNLRLAINNRIDRPTFEKLAAAEHLKPLLIDGIEKVLQGKTSVPEIQRVILGGFQ